MSRTIVCYGDSNTHGVDPITLGRFAPEVRWPGVLQATLGPGFRIVEEGLSGRTTMRDDPFSDFRNGRDYLLPCLWSHVPVDLVTIMLGTNDLKSYFGAPAHEIAAGVDLLVDLARGSLAGPDEMPPRILLIAPAPVGPAESLRELWGLAASIEASRRLGPLYRQVAESYGVAFLDAGEVVSVSPADGVHLDPAAHAALGLAIANAVRSIFGEEPA